MEQISLKDATEEVRALFEEVVRSTILDAKATIENFGRAILIENDEHDFRVWIRISYFKDKGFLVDFSSVSFPEQYRRKGLMSRLIYTSKLYKDTWKVRVTSVLTPEMENCCIKNGLNKVSEYDYEVDGMK